MQVLSWLLEAEDHLLSLHSLGQKQLETVRQRFYNHEDFMLKLRAHQGAVRKVAGWYSQGSTESGLSLRCDKHSKNRCSGFPPAIIPDCVTSSICYMKLSYKIFCE